MFITVKYGEKEEAIFNPHCRIISLLHNIREKCQYGDEVDIELSDESGNVKHLREFPYRYTSELVNERETLILLRVEKLDGDFSKFVPLLNDQETISEEFLTQLASKANLGRPHSRRSRSSSSRRQRSAGNKSTTSDSGKEKPTKNTGGHKSRTPNHLSNGKRGGKGR